MALASGPYSAQIQRALAAFALNPPPFGPGPSTFTGQILVADGTAAAPSYSFASDTNTGFYWHSTDTIGLSNAGVNRFLFRAATASGFMLGSAMPITWAATAAPDPAMGGDLQFARAAPGVLSLGPTTTTGVRLDASVNGALTIRNFGGSAAAAVGVGVLAIGNPVTAAVAVASTHKVEMSVGGVTLYLLATNVP